MDHIKLRKSRDRGYADHGWLKTFHTFSFADYYSEDFMNFRTLRVINEDKVAPGSGFGTHPHRDMEIITYVVDGELAHKDSMGNGSVIKPGCLQRMTAGSGVTHSEFNPSQKQPVHLLQIWILPEKKGLTPSYQELDLNSARKENALTLAASSDAEGRVLKVHQDMNLYFGLLKKDGQLSHSLAKGRGLWLQMIKGAAEINGTALVQGDGVSVEGEEKITVKAKEPAEFLLFDLK